jgi:Na+/H+ antiporter NhaD/arsenite permease-like protein
MIIGIASGIHYADFSAALVPITLLSLGVIWLLLVKFYPHEFSGGDFKTNGPVPAPRIDNHALVKSIIVVAGMLVAFLAGVPIAEASFLAACALLFTRRIDPEKMFANVDWGILVFFAALFVVTGALGANDISQSMLQSVRATLGNNILGLTALTVILSNLVSNVPAVLVLRPVVAGLANPRAGWLVLASASTLAGNLTLLGSVANLIVAEIAARRDIRLSFWEYTRAGLLITLISLIIGTAWLYLTAWAHVV